jgi:hypothetical protein
MSIKESALSTIASISNSDFVRAVTSAGASRRITVTNLAKQIIEGYAGSTVAGAAQSVKVALDSLNSRIANTSFSSVSSLNTAILQSNLVTGLATGAVVSALTNGTVSSTHRFIGYRADDTTADLLLFSLSNGTIVLSRIANGTPTKAYQVSASPITL